jgi:hypothetical protein
MRFEFAGVKYKIWFRYEVDQSHNLKLGDRRETLCFIDEEDTPKGTTFAVGSAVCAPSDTFSKNAGRKVALTKAMPQFRNGRPVITDSNRKIYNVCGGDWDRIKQFRTAAWQCYHKRAEQQPKEVATNG